MTDKFLKKIIAQNQEDLRVVSALCSEAKIKQSDIKYAASRMWIDEIINPKDTRLVLIKSLDLITGCDKIQKPNYNKVLCSIGRC